MLTLVDSLHRSIALSTAHPIDVTTVPYALRTLPWVNIFKEFMELFGMPVDMNELYGKLYNHALTGDDDCGGLLAYNYFSGEHITRLQAGRPMFVRKPDDKFTLANFMQDIPAPLLDRMEIIEVSGYTENEKLHIAKEHLLKKQFEKNGIRKEFL